MKLINLIKEIKVARTWNLDVPGIDPSQFQNGDIITFTLPFNNGFAKVKQRIDDIDYGPEKIKTHDIMPNGEDNLAAVDFWRYSELINFYKD
jgi:hypothetical protein